MNKDVFHALASPCRRKIIELLRTGDLSAGEIQAHFDISQPSVSRHLAVLRFAGVVRARRNVTSIIYSLNREVLMNAMKELNKMCE